MHLHMRSAASTHISFNHSRCFRHVPFATFRKPVLSQLVINKHNKQSRRSDSRLMGRAIVAVNSTDDQWATLKRMLQFMGPALLIPLGDPLMTLTDTIFIGQFAGTRELAALGPANIIFSFAQYIFAALQIAAISLMGDALRKGDRSSAEHNFQVALSLALVCGLAVAGVMQMAAGQLIAATGADSALVALGSSYMRIRALAQPAVLATMVCQGSLLAQQDSGTPAVTVVLTVSTNIICNIVAVAWLGLGLPGAAATTVATQIVGACALVLLILGKRGALRPAITNNITRKDVKAFARTMAPLGVTYVCKNICYILLQTAAASLSLVQLAAHQAVFSVWNLLAFTTGPLEQTALSYIPAAKTERQQQSVMHMLLGLAGCVGLLCGLIASSIPALIPQLFTKDPAVWIHMGKVAPLALLAMLLLAADVGATGVLLAKRDLTYVARAYVVTLTTLWGYMAFVVSGCGWGLTGVWSGLVFFFGARCIQSVSRVFWMFNGQDAPQEVAAMPATQG